MRLAQPRRRSTFADVLVALLACSAFVCSRPELARAAPYMDCGNAPLCGVLALETGLGSGAYAHDTPAVHGLWPEVDQ
jgi:hypothetical protein